MINGCCVTNEAVAKSRKAAARAARTHGRVYVTGCAANLAGRRASPACRRTSPSSPSAAEETAAFVAGDVGAIGCVQADARLDRVRAFVKIQDGCSFSCDFCVIPLVRGASRSRSADAVLARDPPPRRAGPPRGRAHRHQPRLLPRPRAPATTCPRLVREAGATPGLERLRLSSIEINHVDDELVAALRETPTVARHLHVPLQSGDDGVLRAMRRRYTIATYLRRLEPLAGEFNLTSDVIVGFPAEDDAAFERTLRTVERAGITKVHVFPYSPRPGTATAADDPVPPPVKKERGARLRALSHELERRRWRAKLGAHDVVLVDRPGRGYGDDYTPFLVDAPVGELVRVRAERVTEEGIRCRRSMTTACSASIVREGDHVAHDEGLRRDQRHQPAGAGAPARHPRAPRRHASARSASSTRARRSGCSSSSPRPRARPG